MSDDKSRTRGGHPAPAEATVPAPRTPKLRKLPPRTGAKASRTGSGPSNLTGGLTLKIIRYMYPIVGVLLIGCIGIGVWLVQPKSNPALAGNSRNMFTQLDSLQPVSVANRKQPGAPPASPAAPSPPDAAPVNAASTPPGDANVTDVTQILKLLKSVKKPSTAGKDLAQLRELMKMFKKKKGQGGLGNVAQLRELLKSMQGKSAPGQAADAAELQALLSQLEEKGGNVTLRDVDRLRELLNRAAGRNAPVNPDDPRAVQALLSEIIPEGSGLKPEDLQPEDVDKFREILKQVSSKTGPLDLADVQKLRDLLAKSGAAKSPADLDDASQLSAILQDATGKPPARSLDYLARLQDESSADDGTPSSLGISQLSDLQQELSTSSGNQPAIQLGDLNNFAKLVQERAGPDGKVSADDAHEVIEVLKDLTGKKPSPYVDFLSAATGKEGDPDDPQSAAGLEDMNQLNAMLTKVAGPDAEQKLQDLDAPSVRELGNMMQDLAGKSPDKSAGSADQQAKKLSALLEKVTGSPAKMAASDLAQFRDLLANLSSKLDGAADGAGSKTTSTKRAASRRGKTPAIPGLTTLIVDPASRDPQAFKTLSDALAGLPQAGALVVLVGDGPFPLNATRIENKARVVIASSGDALPVISPGAAEPGAAEPGGATAALQVAQGTLDLRGVHFVWNAATISASSPAALVTVTGGDLLVTDCSFTLTGTPAAMIAALAVQGGKPLPGAAAVPNHLPHVRIVNTLVRGDGLSALQLDVEQADVDVRNSLFVTGKAPAVRLENRQRDNAQAERTLRLTNSTLCCREQALYVAAGANPADPVPTHLILVDSLIATGSSGKGQGPSVLLTLKDWPRGSGAGIADKLPPYRNLDWRSQGTAYLGWSTLVQEAQGRPVARSHREWLTLWKEPTTAGNFANGAWPKAPLPKLPNFELALLSPGTLPATLRIGSDGNWPGCPIDLLRAPAKEADAAGSVAAAAPAALWAGRPEFPSNLFPASNAAAINIELGTQDLGQLISSSEWPDGTVFNVSGFGVRLSSPLAVRGKSLRIHFRQTPGDPLVLTPRSANPRTAAKGTASIDDAFISVRNGNLEIVDGMLGTSTSDQPGTPVQPRWLLQVVDGSFSLRNCRIKGPLTGSSRTKGLIQWVRTLAAPGAAGAGRAFESQACLLDSFLSGNGTLIDADMRQRALFVHNCVAVGSQVLSLNLRGTDSSIAGVLDLRRSTLSALGTVFNVRAEKLSLQTSQPLQVFSDHCLFVSPFRTGNQSRTCTLMKYDAPALAQKQIVWREHANGYSPEIKAYLQKAVTKGPAESRPFAAWVSTWGADSVQKPLMVAEGVRLKAELPRRDRVEAIHFELDPECPAATWGDDATSLGADITKIVHLPEPASEPAESNQPNQPPQPKMPAKPKTALPQF